MNDGGKFFALDDVFKASDLVCHSVYGKLRLRFGDLCGVECGEGGACFGIFGGNLGGGFGCGNDFRKIDFYVLIGYAVELS